MNTTIANSGKPLKVLTANVRVSEAADGPNGWQFRRELCLETLASQAADIIGFQEMSPAQYADIKAFLSDYDHYAMHDNVTRFRPQNAVFYRRERFELINASGYWLSETPHVPGSSSWESACVRYANWVRLADRENGKRHLRFINTHLDHVSDVARENQARLLVEDAQAYPHELFQMLTGDMNCDETSLPIKTLTEGGWNDSYAALHGSQLSGFTFHAFAGPDYDSKIGRIDWVMARGNYKVQAAEVIRDSRDKLFPSDHYFVSATFEFE